MAQIVNSLRSAAELIDMEARRLANEQSERARQTKRRKLMNKFRMPCVVCDHVRPCTDTGSGFKCEEHA
jgi:hypothetical protein